MQLCRQIINKLGTSYICLNFSFFSFYYLDLFGIIYCLTNQSSLMQQHNKYWKALNVTEVLFGRAHRHNVTPKCTHYT